MQFPRMNKVPGMILACLVGLLGGNPLGSAALAQEAPARTTLNSYGLPGLLDIPSAFRMPDGDLAGTVSTFAGQTRGTLSFQITPRLTGSFRYSGLRGFSPGTTTPASDFVFYDRSFDLHFSLLEEDGIWPAVAVGLRDFGGTGVYGSEYLVASRHFGPEDQVAVTLGLGWGRLGTRNGFSNPLGSIDDRFDTRPGFDGLGGTFNTGQWFRGDAAVFGGIEWQVNDRLAFQLEYSSDTYSAEQADGVFTEESPVNLGLTYRFDNGAVLGARYMHGAELGLSLTFALNPVRPPVIGGRDPMARPVEVRDPTTLPYATAWASDVNAAATLRTTLSRALVNEGIAVESLSVNASTARISVVNERYDAEAQALGRIARAMSATLPPSVETFEIVFLAEGIPLSLTILNRSDLEELQYHPDGTFLSYGRATITDAAGLSDAGMQTNTVAYPRLDWSLGPYIETSLFDPDDPLRYNVGVELGASYDIRPGLTLSGALRGAAFGTLDESTRASNSVLPRVRSDSNLYDREADVAIRHLTLEHFGRPAPDFYSRVTFGYLEEMYGGLSAELLWMPVNSQFGLGIEVNHVQQRDFDQRFGFQDYSVTTGHASAYFSLADDYDIQIDVGRYLAGDWGATLSVDRTFDNGWRIGAFATLTDVSSEEFGEGSFDKGIRLTVPLSWFTGQSTRTEQAFTIRPVLRDGGARLSVRNRLHDVVRDYHAPSLNDQWGRFWR
ncbi:YjbH domain-containing protein [Roseobacter sp. HKCCD8268]|uniref:YjbH domain-containing protein n=3 Tax=unclassified Roseobacter TaxID=196798 RepID=UPI003460864B